MTYTAPKNRPGLSSLRYRMGTHPTFLRRMFERLSRQEIPTGKNRGERPLAKLATREPSDPAIALLDAWATAADVLTFYQERIANEGYLRTAEERRSVLELARTVGYELMPGVAARAWLAFDVEAVPGVATVPAGTQVLSIPGQDQRPQTFETSRELIAHASWNRLRPAPPEFRKVPVLPGQASIAGTGTSLRPGDVLLLKKETEEALVTLQTVTPDPERDVTEVAWSGEPARGVSDPTLHVFRRRASLFGHNAPDWDLLPKDSTKVISGVTVEFPLSKENFGDKDATEWPGFALPASAIDLDAVYPGILPQSWIVLQNATGSIQPLLVKEVRTVWRDDFTVRGKVTRIQLEEGITVDLGSFGLRDTVVFVESETLELAQEPTDLEIHGDQVELAWVEPNPEPGQVLLFADGEITPGGGGAASSASMAQVASVEAVATPSDRLLVTLQEPLDRAFDPATVVIYGNAVDATHSETIRETLGGGDASRTHQRFVLRVPPLTHLASVRGAESTLEVRVDDVLWHQVPSFFGLGKDSRVYTVRIRDDGVPTVLFGDGVHGARLPSGQENVTATYRSGSGPEGNVAAGSLALLQTRPLGVRSVINPLPASGGAPADDLERARRQAPRSVRTLDRLVSLRDYETFALAFPGVGKVGATLLASTQGRRLHLTVAGLGGGRSSLHLPSLQAAIDAAGDRPVDVAWDVELKFRIRARIRIEPDQRGETVLARVRHALAEAFSFDRRGFGEGVAASEVVAVIQEADGVVAVDLDALYVDEPGAAPALASFLVAQGAREGETDPLPAELLLLDLHPDDPHELKALETPR